MQIRRCHESDQAQTLLAILKRWPYILIKRRHYAKCKTYNPWGYASLIYRPWIQQEIKKVDYKNAILCAPWLYPVSCNHDFPLLKYYNLSHFAKSKIPFGTLAGRIHLNRQTTAPKGKMKKQVAPQNSGTRKNRNIHTTKKGRPSKSPFVWSHLGLNQGPPDYESDALTNWAIGPFSVFEKRLHKEASGKAMQYYDIFLTRQNYLSAFLPYTTPSQRDLSPPVTIL